MRELFELHGEFDVGERAAAELQMELRVFAGWDPLTLDAGLHAPDLAAPVVGHRIAVDERCDEIEETLADFGVARDHARLGQRLELPRLAPAFVVGAVPVERSRKRALVAFGPQPRVDAERRALTRGLADRAHETCRESSPATSKSLAVVPSYTKTTSMSDAYDSSPPPSRPRPITANGNVGFERPQRGSRCTRRRGCELAADRRQLAAADEIARADAEQLAPLESAQPGAPAGFVGAPVERVERGRRRARPRVDSVWTNASSASASTTSGWRCSARPSTRDDPRIWHVRSAATGVSRKRRAIVDDRV